MKNLVLMIIAALALAVLVTPPPEMGGNSAPVPRVADNALSGGAGTVNLTSRDAFARPLSNLATEQLRDFSFGNKLFNTNWVIAPASVKTLDGLGPTFNRVSCSGCHFRDGRGQPPLLVEDAMNSMLIRLSTEGADKYGAPLPHPSYGLQLNDKAIPTVPAEGRAHITYEEIAGAYADGETYSLRKPTYHFSDWGYGTPDSFLFSPRAANAVFGLGLLEAVPESLILALSDPEDKDKDGISGRVNHVWDKIAQKKAIGRFGWKANVATLMQQDADAAQGDIGLTSSINPEQNCPAPQKECAAAPAGDQPELSDKQLEKLVFYSRTLAPPARRDVHDPTVQQGARLFEKIGCAACHTPQMKTGASPIAALAFQDIQPFTDMLVHDMGAGLADNRPDFEASGSEWRTPPLWGVGLIKTVNKHETLLHDGRARGFAEAILWHGGEAETAKESFRNLPTQEREALVVFLRSL